MLFYVNFSVPTHGGPVELRTIGADEAVIVESTDGSVDIAFTDPDGVYIHKLIFDLESQGTAPIHVSVSAFSDSSSTLIEDDNPAYLVSEVINLNKSAVESLHIESDASPVDFRIDNSLNKTPKALIFGALIGAALAGLILIRRFYVLKPDTAFLIIASAMGLGLLISLPSTKVSYDEETHLREVFALAVLPQRDLDMSPELLYQLTVTDYNDPDALPASAEESMALSAVLDSLCDYRDGESTPDFSISLSRVPAYFMMALGARIAMAMGLSWTKVLFAVRLFNLVTYIALMYFAIRIVPRAKPLMMFIGLLPEVLFMASACSYDPFIIGAISLGYAFMLRGKRYLIPMLVCMMLGCLVKAVYAPVLLMGLPAVLGASKDERRRRILITALLAIAFIALIAVFILPTVIDPAESGDVRGGAVSELSQVSFILSSPLAYIGILIPQMISWAGKCWAGPDAWTFMGHLVNGGTAFKGYYQIYMLMLTALIAASWIGTSHRRDSGDIPERIWLILMVILSSVLIWTAMFVAFTEPGATEIAGVQGRYFIPLMFPLYYCLSGHGETHASPGRLARFGAICYDLWVLIEFFALILVIWRVCISVFCI